MEKNLKILLLSFWFIIFFLIYFHQTNSFDQDLGRHIKLGEIIWQTKSVPKTNLFSYTNQSEHTFNSHWGSQLIFYGVYKNSGVDGLILLNALINAIAFGLIFTSAVKRVGFLIPSLLFIPFLYIFLDRTWIRPEAFANLFFAIFLIMIFSKKFRQKFIWSVPLIMFFWVNLHISWILGLFMAGIIFAMPFRPKLAALTVIAIFLNPYGFDGILNSLSVLNKYGYTIVENQSLFFLKDFNFPFVWHILIGFLIVCISFFLTFHIKRKFLLEEIILLLVVGILTLRFVRNEIFFGYIAFIVSSLNFGQLKRIRESWGDKGYRRIGLSILVGLISIGLISQNHEAHGLPIGFGNQESYQKGVDYFAKFDLKGPIFNNFDIGGYLIYRLYPREKVFVDNRPEAYPVDFFEKVYKPAQENPKKFEEIVNQYGIQTIIWGINDITPWSRAFLENIKENKSWKQIFLDEALVIFAKQP